MLNKCIYFNLCVSLYDLMIFCSSPQIYIAPFLFLCVCVCGENVDGMLVICVLVFISFPQAQHNI